MSYCLKNTVRCIVEKRTLNINYMYISIDEQVMTEFIDIDK